MRNRKFMCVTLVLIAVNILIWLIEVINNISIYGGIGLIYAVSGSTGSIGTDFGLLPAAVAAGEKYRLFTCMFLHAGAAHLFSNMIALYCVGLTLERWAGHVKMIIIYMLSGICGSLLAMVLSGPATLTVGASGAIFGGMGAAFVQMVRNRNFRMSRALLINIVINIVVTFSSSGISIGGHVGGLVCGLLLGLIILRRTDFRG